MTSILWLADFPFPNGLSLIHSPSWRRDTLAYRRVPSQNGSFSYICIYICMQYIYLCIYWFENKHSVNPTCRWYFAEGGQLRGKNKS